MPNIQELRLSEKIKGAWEIWAAESLFLGELFWRSIALG